jgi:hypothetical protein
MPDSLVDVVMNIAEYVILVKRQTRPVFEADHGKDVDKVGGILIKAKHRIAKDIVMLQPNHCRPLFEESSVSL